jgi:hypothetical protein
MTMPGSRNELKLCDELRAGISGRKALPVDELYDEGCRVWNGAVRRRDAEVEDAASMGQPWRSSLPGTSNCARAPAS